jgi:hypothetical protein
MISWGTCFLPIFRGAAAYMILWETLMLEMPIYDRACSYAKSVRHISRLCRLKNASME